MSGDDGTQSGTDFQITPDDAFPHLKNAPIAEAVIQFTTSARTQWDEPTLMAALDDLLPEYPNRLPERLGEFQVNLSETTAETRVQAALWHGIRLTSADGLNIARFLRDRFSASRLSPYQDWGAFQNEALRCWDVYREIAHPEAIQRIGVRFINRLQMPSEGAELDQFFVHAPQTPAGLESIPMFGFLYQERLVVPNYPYQVTTTRTVEPPSDDAPQYAHLILDVDVYTTEPMSLELNEIIDRLRDMRWLKDKVFFGSIQPPIINALREEG